MHQIFDAECAESDSEANEGEYNLQTSGCKGAAEVSFGADTYQD